MKNMNEFYTIIEEYSTHPKVLEMKDYIHHGIKRYDHCFRVAKYTYIITKKLHLNYHSATKAAMLHDFYTDELLNEPNSWKRFSNHPKIAILNSKKYFHLTELEEDIIGTHMFPITIKPPKYLESWLVDIIDDSVSIYEKCYTGQKGTHSIANIALLFIFMLFR